MNLEDLILRDAATGFVVDTHLAPASGDIAPALAAMSAIEAGSMANIHEQRRVGHYWLRAPQLAPTPEITEQIQDALRSIRSIDATGMDTLLQIGFGGSALGPELVIDALKKPGSPRFVLVDTVDPAGLTEILRSIEPKRTMVIVASKSGLTPETRTALRIVEAKFESSGVCMADQSIAITGPNSPLADLAKSWKLILPVWDWVGGRTSVCSPVGLAAMHLCGIDIDAFLRGAAAMDVWTRTPAPNNPAALMALLWAQGGHDSMAVLPYVNGLRHLTRHLQQLIMESLGKAEDRNGQTVHRGLTVFGNKGSADQHAIVQQLRDGPDGVMIHFIDVAGPSTGSPLMQDAADLQFALLSGTRRALAETGRPVVSITLPDLEPASLGALIALFERVVGLTAELWNINAYDQPGVEAGKLQAKCQLDQISEVLSALGPTGFTALELGGALDLDHRMVWRIASHLAHTGRARLHQGSVPSEDRFSAKENKQK